MKTEFCFLRHGNVLRFYAPIMGGPRFIDAQSSEDFTRFDTVSEARLFLRGLREQGINVAGIGIAEINYSITPLDSETVTD